MMRYIGFILAFALTLAAPSVAGSAQTGLPGVGTFTYSGSPAVMPAVIVVAGLTRADRS